jgi:hypothetical protein
LDNFRCWFDTYTQRFFCEDEHVNAHLRLKQEHTRRTCEEILYLAERLALDGSQKRIAEAIALLHDVGRFPQFAKYRTYNDARSVDHARLSVETLRQEGVLDALRREERQWVETAIECHNQKSLPEDLSGQAMLFAKLIRDADKLDILRLIVELHQHRRDDPDGFWVETELPEEPEVSPEVLEAVMNGRVVEYAKLRTLNDMRLCQIGWVYDMNFAAALERLSERGHLDALFAYLPQTPDVLAVREKIHAYVKTRLEEVEGQELPKPLAHRPAHTVTRPGPSSR